MRAFANQAPAAADALASVTPRSASTSDPGVAGESSTKAQRIFRRRAWWAAVCASIAGSALCFAGRPAASQRGGQGSTSEQSAALDAAEKSVNGDDGAGSGGGEQAVAGGDGLEAPAASAKPPAFEAPGAAVGLPSAAAESTAGGRFGQALRDREALDALLRRFEQYARQYHTDRREFLERRHEARREQLHQSYEESLIALEKQQRERRAVAIAQFEAFVERYPDVPEYTPNALFRLAELYFESSYDAYFQARQQYDKLLEAWTTQDHREEPVEPRVDYGPTIATMRQLIERFADYTLVDGAYYLLGYCLGEQGEEEQAVVVYRDLVSRHPDSRFAPEVWTRIGEFQFNSNELEGALEAYTHVVEHEDSPFYDKALYKLAWTHYRLADPEQAPDEYQRAVDTFIQLLEFNERTKAEGQERGRDLRRESIQYIAVCYADDAWGSAEKLLEYLSERPGRAYERDVLLALADVYFEQTRFDEAVRLYLVAQQRAPYHPDAPVTQQKIVTAYERHRAFEQAAQARSALSWDYVPGTPWHERNADNPEALRRALELTQGIAAGRRFVSSPPGAEAQGGGEARAR